MGVRFYCALVGLIFSLGDFEIHIDLPEAVG